MEVSAIFTCLQLEKYVKLTWHKSVGGDLAVKKKKSSKGWMSLNVQIRTVKQLED